MKKNYLMGILTLVVIGVGILFFNACKKENFEPNEQVSIVQPDNGNGFATGCELAPADVYASFPQVPDATEKELKALKASYFLACPAVRSQGSESSCTAWGTTYAGKTIRNRLSNTFSPEFVYNTLTTCPSTCTCGLYVSTALNLLRSSGACRYSVMPSVTGCSVKPNTTQKNDAAYYKTSSWSTTSITTSNIKAKLGSGNPVIVAGPTNATYNSLASGATLKAFTGTNYGNHCYCIMGYDDAKNAFKFINSWGTSWASSGYGWIDYNYLTSWVKEAYVISN